MGLFRKSREPEVDETPDEPEAAAAPAEQAEAPDAAGEQSRGPYDVEDVEDRANRLDLGCIWLPGVEGMELRMEVDKKTERVTGVTCALAGSALEVKAFAAPRSAGIWDEIREEIGASVTKQGGTVDDVPGTFGRELIARLPVRQGGRQTFRPVRFIGVDGPRWFLRGVLTGKAALDAKEADALEGVFGQIVVVRDGSPRPPRDLLELRLPGEASAAAEADGSQSFDPMTRGPEITEVR